MSTKIELKVNGRVIALNPFVKKIFINLVLGAVQALDKIPQPMETIEIALQPEKEKEVVATP
jgi:hypothetical protein